MLKKICYWIGVMMGWKFDLSAIPASLKSYVLVGAPHTSNWDFIPAMGLMSLMKGNPRFIIKKSWLFFPLNLILVPMGAFGVDRNLAKGANQTDMLADIFKQDPNFIMMISPEGTRSPNDKWKTGFFAVAQKAQVPIVVASADYAKKLVKVEKILTPHDLDQDMKEMIQIYRTITAKNLKNFKLDQRFL